MKRENYYILLELDFDPPVLDEGQIRAALASKKQEWTRMQDNPSTRNRALKYLGFATDIERTMTDPILRGKEAQEARTQKKEALRDFEAELRVLEGKGYILPKESADIVSKYAPYGINDATLEKSRRCPVSDAAPAPVAATPDDRPAIIDRMTAKNICRSLENTGHKDLYEFLGLPGYSSIKKLRDAAEDKRRWAASNAKRNALTVATQELAGICLQQFQSFETKSRYDRYVVVSGFPALNDLIHDEGIRSKHISDAVLLRLINFGVEKYGTSVLNAEAYIKEYCLAYGFPVGNRGSVERRGAGCPECGADNDKDARMCGTCGSFLQGPCPSCGVENQMGAVVCNSCGFRIGAMHNALKYIEHAKAALDDKRWSAAMRNLEYARRFWPTHRDIAGLELQVQTLSDEYKTFADGLDDCISKGQLYAAAHLLTEAERQNVALPEESVRLVQASIGEVERILDAAKARDSLTPEFLLELTKMVTDSIEINRMLSKYPPQDPPVLQAKAHEGRIRLYWGATAADGDITYRLVRKEGIAPGSPSDGDEVYVGELLRFEDKTALKLVEYYYRVFAIRGGTSSPTGATVGPVVIVPELEDLVALPGDGRVHMTWKFDEQIREVLIWRKLGGERPAGGGDGIQLENKRLDGFSDSRLKNGVDYWYYIVTGYQVGDSVYHSRGRCESIMPHPVIAPIDELVVAAAGEDEYVINWNNTRYEDVMLLSCPHQPYHRSGDMAPVAELIRKYRRLDIESRHADSGRFHLELSGGVYIFAAVVAGRFATVGEPAYLINVRDVSKITGDATPQEMFINMKWPPGIREVAVTYRFDRYPESVAENGTTVVRCTREQYDYDAAVVIRDPEPGVYFITIFSVFTTPEGKTAYSPGANAQIDNRPIRDIHYKLRYRRSAFASSSKVWITLSSPVDEPYPQSVVVGKIGRVPLKVSDGMTLFSLDDRDGGGVVIHEFKTTVLPKDLYIKMFFCDEKQYKKTRLVADTSCKIT